VRLSKRLASIQARTFAHHYSRGQTMTREFRFEHALAEVPVALPFETVVDRRISRCLSTNCVRNSGFFRVCLLMLHQEEEFHTMTVNAHLLPRLGFTASGTTMLSLLTELIEKTASESPAALRDPRSIGGGAEVSLEIHEVEIMGGQQSPSGVVSILRVICSIDFFQSRFFATPSMSGFQSEAEVAFRVHNQSPVVSLSWNRVAFLCSHLADSLKSGDESSEGQDLITLIVRVEGTQRFVELAGARSVNRPFAKIEL
jgi:hypothetical protein